MFKSGNLRAPTSHLAKRRFGQAKRFYLDFSVDNPSMREIVGQVVGFCEAFPFFVPESRFPSLIQNDSK